MVFQCKTCNLFTYAARAGTCFNLWTPLPDLHDYQVLLLKIKIGVETFFFLEIASKCYSCKETASNTFEDILEAPSSKMYSSNCFIYKSDFFTVQNNIANVQINSDIHSYCILPQQ